MKIEFDELCKSCQGTGLYIGMAERDGAAVVCSKCKGTGCFHFVHEYEKFESRKYLAGVHRVFQTNPGVMICKEGGVALSDFGGMSVADWSKGKEFLSGMENRKYTCPAMWYQSVDYKKRPTWNECIASLGRPFSKCPYFIDKDKCWERWDNELKTCQRED